jgi:chromosome segregation ATPase
LLFEADELEKEVVNMHHKMKDDFRTAQDKLQPKLDKYQIDIQENKAMNDKTKNTIENLQRILEENMQKILTIKKENSELEEEEEKLKEIRLKIKDSPDHYAKSAENLNIEIFGMENELKDLREEIERKEKICTTFREKMEQQKEQIEQLKAEREETFQVSEEVGTNIEAIKNMISGKEIVRGQLKVDIMDKEKSIKDTEKSIKY